MKLIRNLPDNVGGKYTVIDNRTGEQAKGEFFCLALRDMAAQGALIGYAGAIAKHDPEFAKEVMNLAMRSGPDHPDRKWPD